MNHIPEELLETIRSGDCVAFLGAGFAGAAKLPSWRGLLEGLAARRELTEAQRAHILALLRVGTAHAFDEAAQLMEDALGREAFTAELDAKLGRPPATAAMDRRLAWIRGIPFRAILTTNFDALLDGHIPGPEAYREVLRPEGSNPWWKHLFQTGTFAETGTFTGVPVVKIHGDVRRPESVIITRKDYRRLLYGNPGYQAFLRALLAHRPVLYVGFSFTDAYLNEARSEVLALLGYAGDGPVAYAIVNDVSEHTRAHYMRHEGIHILTYDTDGLKDFSGLDRLLEEIHDHTNPQRHFGGLLEGKRILWIDPRPGNNDHIARFFLLAKGTAGVRPGSFRLDTAPGADEALQQLRAAQEARRPFHLVISHWGHQPPQAPTAVRVLEGMRRQALRSPVLIFSTASHAGTRKPKALSLGAQGYCFTNEGLLRSIERILSPGQETG